MLRNLLRLLLLIFPVAAFAQTGTPKDKAALQTEINTNLPDQTTGAITPSILRTTMSDMLASWQQYATVNTQTGTSYTIVAIDYGKLITFNNASPVAVTLPAATGSFATFSVFITNKGAGLLTITPASGNVGGAPSMTMGQNQSNMVVASAGNWEVFRGADGGGGSGTPGGSSGNIQFNNAGSFAGLTDTQLTARLDPFSSTLKGAVPASGGGSINFLRADGTWAVPAGGGGGVPGGSNLQVQYNNAGAFAGLTDAALTARIARFTGSLSGSVPASGGGTTTFLRADGNWAAPTTSGGGSSLLNSPMTTGWWGGPVNVNKIGDKLFIGDAINYNNAGPSTCGSDWFSNFEGTTAPNGCGGYIAFSQVIVEAGSPAGSSGSAIAFLGAAQSAHAPNAGAALIGVSGFGLANDSVGAFTWAAYFECNRTTSGSEGCNTLEAEATQFLDDTGDVDAYNFNSHTLVLNLACGSGLSSPTTYTCGSAISIGANPAKFANGIRFGGDPIRIGSGGVINAINMGPAYSIVWNTGGSTIGGRIYLGNAGNLNLDVAGGHSLATNGSAGVNCPGGINAGSFRAVNGLVTSC